jgi:hypothetical protein
VPRHGQRRPEAQGARQRERPAAPDRDDGIGVGTEEDPEEAAEELGTERRHVPADEEDEGLAGDLETGEQADEGARVGRRVADEPKARRWGEIDGFGSLRGEDDDDLPTNVGEGRHGVGEEGTAGDGDGKLVPAEAGRPPAGEDDAGRSRSIGHRRRTSLGAGTPPRSYPAREATEPPRGRL